MYHGQTRRWSRACERFREVVRYPPAICAQHAAWQRAAAHAWDADYLRNAVTGQSAEDGSTLVRQCCSPQQRFYDTRPLCYVAFILTPLQVPKGRESNNQGQSWAIPSTCLFHIQEVISLHTFVSRKRCDAILRSWADGSPPRTADLRTRRADNGLGPAMPIPHDIIQLLLVPNVTYKWHRIIVVVTMWIFCLDLFVCHGTSVRCPGTPAPLRDTRMHAIRNSKQYLPSVNIECGKECYMQ